MKISVQVKTNSKVESVDRLPDGSYIVRVHVPPVEGKANERIRELLADYFNSPKGGIELVSGFKGKHKIFSVRDR
ncbi:MAG: DUF167 domain-containing protein [Bacteriovoracia bacterium]